MKLAIYGAGGLGREAKEYADLQNEQEEKWSEIFFLDDGIDEGKFFGTRLVHWDTFLESDYFDETEVVLTLGDPVSKRKVFESIKDSGCRFGQIVAPSARVSKTAKVGSSLVVLEGAIVESLTELGDCVVVDNYATVGRDSVVGSYCHIAAKSSIGGESVLGEGVFIGLCVSTKQCNKIGSYVTVGMGSVVLKDLPDEVVAVGNPCRILRKHDKDTRSL